MYHRLSVANTLLFSLIVPAALSQVQISLSSSTQQSGRQYGCPGDLALFTCSIANAPLNPDEGIIEVEVFLSAEAQSTRVNFRNNFTTSIFSEFSGYLLKNIGNARSIVINYMPLPTSNFSIYCAFGSVNEEIAILVADVPSMPRILSTWAIQVSSDYYFVGARWAPGVVNFDLRHYELEVDGVVSRSVETEMTLVFNGTLQASNVPVQVSTVNACGMRSEAAVASATVSRVIAPTVAPTVTPTISSSRSAASCLHFKLGVVTALMNSVLFFLIS